MSDIFEILHLSTEYSTGTSVYKHLIEAINEYKIHNRVFVPLLNKKKKYCSKYVSEIPCFNQLDSFFYFSKQIKVKNTIKRIYNPQKFNIICAHTLFSTGYAAYMLKKEYGFPYIVSVINTDVNVFFKKMLYLRKVGIKIMREASAIIFISKPYRENVINKYVPEKLRKEFLEKTYVIPFSIDDFYLNNPPHNKNKLECNKIKIVEVVRNFDKNKNLKVVVKAAKLLNKNGKDTTLTLIGNINSTRNQKLINKYDFVKHISYSSKENLIGYLRDAHIFIMASKKETFGLVYVEAMSQGLPIIYSRNQGFDGNFKEGEVGYSVDSSDCKEIVDKVIAIIGDYSNISERCVNNSQKFNSRIIAEKYINVFEEIYSYPQN